MTLNQLRALPQHKTIGGLLLARGDAVFAYRGREVLMRFERRDEADPGRFVLAWEDDKGVPMRWSDPNEATAVRVGLWLAEHGCLPPSQRRKTKTLTGLEPVRKAV